MKQEAKLKFKRGDTVVFRKLQPFGNEGPTHYHVPCKINCLEGEGHARFTYWICGWAYEGVYSLEDICSISELSKDEIDEIKFKNDWKPNPKRGNPMTEKTPPPSNDAPPPPPVKPTIIMLKEGSLQNSKEPKGEKKNLISRIMNWFTED